MIINRVHKKIIFTKSEKVKIGRNYCMPVLYCDDGRLSVIFSIMNSATFITSAIFSKIQ